MMNSGGMNFGYWFCKRSVINVVALYLVLALTMEHSNSVFGEGDSTTSTTEESTSTSTEETSDSTTVTTEETSTSITSETTVEDTTTSADTTVSKSTVTANETETTTSTNSDANTTEATEATTSAESTTISTAPTTTVITTTVTTPTTTEEGARMCYSCISDPLLGLEDPLCQDQLRYTSWSQEAITTEVSPTLFNALNGYPDMEYGKCASCFKVSYFIDDRQTVHRGCYAQGQKKFSGCSYSSAKRAAFEANIETCYCDDLDLCNHGISITGTSVAATLLINILLVGIINVNTI